MQWEYEVNLLSKGNLQEELNQAGAAGWQLVVVGPDDGSDYWLCIFKRPKASAGG